MSYIYKHISNTSTSVILLSDFTLSKDNSFTNEWGIYAVNHWINHQRLKGI